MPPADQPVEPSWVDQLPIGVVQLHDGVVTRANRAAAEILDEKLEGQPLDRWIDEGDLRRTIELVQSGPREEGSPLRHVVHARRRSGQHVRIELEARVVDAHQTLLAFSRAEPRLASSGLILALYELSLRMQNTLGVGEIIQLATSGLLDAGFQTFIARDDGDTMTIVEMKLAQEEGALLDRLGVSQLVGKGLPANAFSMLVDPPKGSLGPLLIDSARPVADLLLSFIPDLDRTISSRVLDLADGLRVCFCAIPSGPRWWGYAAILAKDFAPTDAAAFAMFCAQLGLAISWAQTIERLKKRQRELAELHEQSPADADSDPERHAHALLNAMASTLESDGGTLYLFEESRQQLELAAYIGNEEFANKYRVLPGESMTAKIAFSGMPRRFHASELPAASRDDVTRYGYVAGAFFPIRHRERTIGLVHLMRRINRVYSDEELEWAMIFARQIALQIENVRLYSSLSRSYRELQQTQVQLVERQRLAALGELSAVVAHEVRNPLGVLFNSLGVLRRALPSSNELAKVLDIVGEETNRLNLLVGDLLEFAKPSDPQMKATVVSELLQRAADTASSMGLRGEAVPIHVDAPNDLPRIFADERLLRRGIVNLLVNALQVSPDGKPIKVRASLESSDPLGPTLRVDVMDEGPGVPHELSDKVFQPFFTTRATGSGLGLAIVKRAIDAHRGRVCLNAPSLSSGATFSIWLPLQQPAASGP